MEVENLHCLLRFFTLLLMEQSNASKSTRKGNWDWTFQNDELMNDIPITETSIENLNLHAQRLFWKLEGRNAICWAFNIVNDNTPMDGKIPQVVRCHLCYKTLVLHNPKIKLRKGLISY
jgi:hypothetical protein